MWKSTLLSNPIWNLNNESHCKDATTKSSKVTTDSPMPIIIKDDVEPVMIDV